MPVGGTFNSDDLGPLKWEVERYRMRGDSGYRERGANKDELDSSKVENAVFKVTDQEGSERYLTLWGPYINDAAIDDALNAYFNEGDYGDEF